MNPLVVSFTIVAAVALALHGWWFRELLLDRQAIVTSGKNGLLQTTANMLVQTEGARVIFNVLLFATGFGILVGIRQSGWLLTGLPLASLVASILRVRSLHRGE